MPCPLIRVALSLLRNRQSYWLSHYWIAVSGFAPQIHTGQSECQTGTTILTNRKPVCLEFPLRCDALCAFRLVPTNTESNRNRNDTILRYVCKGRTTRTSSDWLLWSSNGSTAGASRHSGKWKRHTLRRVFTAHFQVMCVFICTYFQTAFIHTHLSHSCSLVYSVRHCTPVKLNKMVE